MEDFFQLIFLPKLISYLKWNLPSARERWQDTEKKRERKKTEKVRKRKIFQGSRGIRQWPIN